MLPHILVNKLNKQMNMELRSTEIYFSSSTWFYEQDLIETGHLFRNLAQLAVNRTMKYYDFLNKYECIPYLRPDAATINLRGNTLKNIIRETISDYKRRNNSREITESIAMRRSCLVAIVFMCKLKELHINEAQHLMSAFKSIHFQDFHLARKLN